MVGSRGVVTAGHCHTSPLSVEIRSELVRFYLSKNGQKVFLRDRGANRCPTWVYFITAGGSHIILEAETHYFWTNWLMLFNYEANNFFTQSLEPLAQFIFPFLLSLPN